MPFHYCGNNSMAKQPEVGEYDECITSNGKSEYAE